MMKFIKDENGQGMLEYVLIIALVVIAVVAIVLGVRNYLGRQDLENKLNNLDSTAPAGA
ncbi:Flp family type IVb pilin [uncultured Eubacterium sp.]|uniref:Flp family type IVb pilin n=1 Tax=uncultured Eubacterium sp. TaxID=165185 RepID=UPI0015ADC346|nr:Flp family type IVb pilin [uncultured Eubacterium sp.]